MAKTTKNTDIKIPLSFVCFYLALFLAQSFTKGKVTAIYY